MMKLIDADNLMYELHNQYFFDCDDRPMVLDKIEAQPTIEIVTCKECRDGEYREDFDDYECHCTGWGLVNDGDFYCADGKRKEEIMVNAPKLKRGKWILQGLSPYEGIRACSECWKEYDIRANFNFCPNCGADMRGEEQCR